MSKFETGEPMRYGDVDRTRISGYPFLDGIANKSAGDGRHCWAVQGTSASGGFFSTRYVPGLSPDVASLSHAESMAKLRASQLNANGANVKAVKQHLDINDLWQDSL